MTKLALGLLALAFSTSTVFAQDYLNCGLKISDNKIDCPFFGSCPHKELKNSQTQLFLEVNEGDEINGEIHFQNVILYPGTKKEKKNKVTIFKRDERARKLQEGKKVDLVIYGQSNSIIYSVKKLGETLNISFKTPVYKLGMELSGNAKHQDYILTSQNAVSVTCERLNKSVYEEFKAKKEALDKHAQAKKAKSVSKR